MDKKSWYEIPYWDQVRISQLQQPAFDTGVEHLNARQIDKCHYLLSQVVFENDEPLKYELLFVTIHGYVDENHYHYKSYKPLKVVWF